MEYTNQAGADARGAAGAGSAVRGSMSRSTHYHVEAWRPTPGMRERLARAGRVPVIGGLLKMLVRDWSMALPRRSLYWTPLWELEADNLVVTAGLNDSLDKHFKGSSYTASWYVGITTDADTFAAADTMSSHAGWTECEAYDEATRPALTLGSVSGGSVDNSASKARFTISTNSTVIGGAFVATNSTKGGSTGTLYGGAAFTAGNKTLDDGDTLDVTVTLTATAA